MAGSTPGIDVMMPYYGDVPLMQAAVRSVLAQTDPDWHLTVVDDGTAAGVPEWFEQLAEPRVTYLRNERNLGISGNFQKCLELAKRDRVVIMGCDDLLLPNYIATVRALALAHPNVGLVQPGVRVIDESGESASSLADTIKRRLYAPKELLHGTEPVVLEGEELALSLLRGNWLYFPSLCWRTDAIQATTGFREDLRVVQDMAVVLQLVESGEALVADGVEAFEYRRHAESESSRAAVDGSRFDESRRFFTETARRMDEIGWHRAARVSRRHRSTRLHALTLAPTALRQGDAAAFRRLVRYAASTR
ncbi:MAG TPA: glycosyltransferase [Actinospica sp.]|jgi:GT2 family glycosyltransferase|nr:glycosyltransferase [Actinospica sp.]